MNAVSFLLHGIGVSSGIAIGRAQLVSHATLEVSHYDIKPEQVPKEIERLDAAIKQVTRELDALWGQIQETDTPSEVGAFIDVHAMLLRDDMLTSAPREIIATDAAPILEKLGLRDHLTPQRSNGFASMILRIKADAARALQASSSSGIAGR